MARSRARPIPLRWWIQTITVGSHRLQVGRLRLRLFFRSAGPRSRLLAERCWFDSGASLSVIPFYIHHQRLAWQSLGVQSTWAGQPCDLGVIETWFPTRQRAVVRGPISLLAKFPRSDPPGDPVPVLLGLEFLLAQRALLALPPPPRQGSIQIP